MRKPSTRAIVTKPATVKAAKADVAKAATAARATISTADASTAAKLASGVPTTATAIVAPVAAPVATPAVAKPSGNVTRTAATIAAQRTHFAVISDRDTAYLAFFTKLANRNGGTCNAQQINAAVTSGETPNYAGSCKPNDAGVRVRLHKAGRIINSADGLSFTIAPLPVPTVAPAAKA